MTVQTDPIWDLLVIGGGTAGLLAAKTAAGLGAQVALVERARTGGDCLWTGCVPSKALQSAAAAAADARAAGRFGIDVGQVQVDFPRVMAHVHAAIATIAPVDSIETLEAVGVTVFSGDAQFAGPGRLAVDGAPVQYRQAVIATGSEPVLPRIPGLADVTPLTADTVWDLVDLPERLVMIGGGSSGCELGQAFARLGSRVTVLEAADRVLPAEDPDASALIREALVTDGVEVITGARIERVGAGVLEHAGGRVEFDQLLVLAGRRPRTAGLGLESVGVELDEAGWIRVDSHLRTSAAQLWAAGDITGAPLFTHTAGVHGTIAAINALLGPVRSVRTAGEPRVTFTRPEVAAVGVPTAGARTVQVRHDELDRAVTEGEVAGFSRLAVGRRGRIIGATVVGPRAGETIGELALAVGQQLTTGDLAGVTHPYPTWSDGAWNAAVADYRSRLGTPVASRLTGLLMRLRRWWVSRR
ncbi:MAG: FAD-dependent oxidoreductase [Nakamurella sp.]